MTDPDSSYRTISLTQGQFALVDTADFDWLMQWKWYAAKTGSLYAQRATYNPRRVVKMHRLIVGLEHGDPRQVDHINHQTLDNRRSNLRICAQFQNARNRPLSRGNSSGYMGVSWNIGVRKYIANIRVNGLLIHLGCFADPIEAAMVRDEASLKHFGEFASLNFPLAKPIAPESSSRPRGIRAA